MKEVKLKKTYKSKKEAIEMFERINEKYKVEIIKESVQENNFQIYQQCMSNFFDLCKGPHLPDMKFIGPFKLTKLAGAYWRGDSKNVMLQRIYGTAWNTEKELKNYLFQLEEAEKRDHRKLGKELNLFTFKRKQQVLCFGILRVGQFTKI